MAKLTTSTAENSPAFGILQGLVTLARNGESVKAQSEWLIAEIDAALNAEREACALACEGIVAGRLSDFGVIECAKIIRKRKTK